MPISKRKQEHWDIVRTRNVGFRTKSAGFDRWELVPCALPEMRLSDVSLTTEFLGKTLRMPLMIGAMTGGFSGAESINRILAEAAASTGIALAVGSQRSMMEGGGSSAGFRIVRKLCPKGVVVGNIGAAHLARMEDFSPVLAMVESVEADAMAVHLNPLQEVLQPEGDKDFSGVWKAIRKLVRFLPIPVIVKEVGCGISGQVARRLADAGVRYIDVAGAGGTSWAGVESFRNRKNHLAHAFWDWGIPTAKALEDLGRIRSIRVIASGGIDSGITLAKALALGAVLGSAARPFVPSLRKGVDGPAALVRRWEEELRITMFLTGSRTIRDLRRKGVLERSPSLWK
jgi:isopentenyl-diphosphate delta-isomerase